MNGMTVVAGIQQQQQQQHDTLPLLHLMFPVSVAPVSLRLTEVSFSAKDKYSQTGIKAGHHDQMPLVSHCL